MQKHFLKEKIEIGFKEEQKLLEHEPLKREKLPLLFYVRPLYFAILVIATLSALLINGVTALKFFMTH